MNLSDIGNFASAVTNSGFVFKRKMGIFIESAGPCNLSCNACPSALDKYVLKRKRNFMTDEDFYKIVEVTKGVAYRYNLHIFGEPMLHKNIAHYVDYLKEFPVYISTNLNYPVQKLEKISRSENLTINCSVDVTEEELYARYRRGGNFQKVLTNLKYLLDHGRCQVQVTFFKFDSKNENQKVYQNNLPSDEALMGKVQEFAKKYALKMTEKNVRLKNMVDPWVGVNEDHLALEEKKCHEMYRNIFFSCDGYLVPCCNNFSEDLWMRHISDIQSEKDLLNGPKTREFRHQLSKDKNVYEACRSCKGHEYYALKDLVLKPAEALRPSLSSLGVLKPAPST